MLYKIATDKTLSRERCMAAVERITDQEMLMKIAMYEDVCETTYICVSYAAMNLLEKSEDICKVVRGGNSITELNYDAVCRITDPEVLGRVACLVTDPKTALYALRQITDQKRIHDAAVVGKSFEVNAEAVEMLTDRELLMQLAKNDGESKAHELALNKINDPADLADIAKNAKTEVVRLRAVKKLSDEDSLADVARYSEYNDSRILAIRKLENRDILMDLANKCTDPEIINAVLNKIDDSET